MMKKIKTLLLVLCCLLVIRPEAAWAYYSPQTAQPAAIAGTYALKVFDQDKPTNHAMGMKVVYVNKWLHSEGYLDTLYGGRTWSSSKTTWRSQFLGVYSSYTVSAMKKFQADYNRKFKEDLRTDGVCDYNSFIALAKVHYGDNYNSDKMKNLWKSGGTQTTSTEVYRTPYQAKGKDAVSVVNAMVSVAKTYAEADTAYAYGCSGKPGTYTDCSGLVIQCLYGAGIYPDTFEPVMHTQTCNEYGSRILAADKNLGTSIAIDKSYSNLQKGDLVFYSSVGSSTVIHVGLYAGSKMIYDNWPGVGVSKRSIDFDSASYKVCKVIRVVK